MPRDAQSGARGEKKKSPTSGRQTQPRFFPSFRVFQTGEPWQRVGLTSEFPEISNDTEACAITQSCKAFRIPKTKGEEVVEADIDLPGDLKDQVLVFKYKGKVHAIDHVRYEEPNTAGQFTNRHIQQCPHSSFPLSQGNLFDIEDFGITLSTGITCPKHGWSFDIISGKADRGNYKLKVWEVQLRDVPGGSDSEEKEVWVRRKQRIG
jgi:nitrite reductase/ring-hydroxylating ferredoxin subunit